jgi:hypothetical protein
VLAGALDYPFAPVRPEFRSNKRQLPALSTTSISNPLESSDLNLLNQEVEEVSNSLTATIGNMILHDTNTRDNISNKYSAFKSTSNTVEDEQDGESNRSVMSNSLQADSVMLATSLASLRDNASEAGLSEFKGDDIEDGKSISESSSVIGTMELRSQLSAMNADIATPLSPRYRSYHLIYHLMKNKCNLIRHPFYLYCVELN